jgi:hypothetical protein
MRQSIAAAALVLSALVAGGVHAAGTPVRASMAGDCHEVKYLDRLGVLKSLSYACTAKNASFVYKAIAAEPGTGASGHEVGTLVASGPEGTVTLKLEGTRTAGGISKGTWLMGEVTGYKGVRLARHGTYSSTTTTLSTTIGTLDSSVEVVALIGCWRCSGV